MIKVFFKKVIPIIIVSLFLLSQILKFSLKHIYPEKITGKYFALHFPKNMVRDSTVLREVVSLSDSLLSLSEITNEGSTKIFLLQSPFLFSFLVPTSRGGFAAYSRYSKTVVVRKTGADRKFSIAKGGYKLPLHRVLAHETTHFFLEEYPANKNISTNFKEGYCEYVAFFDVLDQDLEKKHPNKTYLSYMREVERILKDKSITDFLDGE